MDTNAEDIPTIEEACQAAYGTSYPYDTQKTDEELKQERRQRLRRRRLSAAIVNEHNRT